MNRLRAPQEGHDDSDVHRFAGNPHRDTVAHVLAMFKIVEDGTAFSGDIALSAYVLVMSS